MAKGVVTPILIICVLCVFAYFAKGLTGAASAIVFNAGLLSALALGLAGGLGLLDGLYWIALADVFGSGLLAILLRKHFKFETFTALLLAGMVPMIVLFALLLPRLDLQWLTLVLAAAVFGGGVYLAFRKDLPPVNPKALNWWAVPTGATAGVLGGLFGMGGPIIFILLSRASDDPSAFRSRTLVITNVAGITRLLTLIFAGAYEPKHFEWFGVAVPVIVGALLLGMWAHYKVKPRPFRVVLGLLVMIAGIGGLLRFALG